MQREIKSDYLVLTNAFYTATIDVHIVIKRSVEMMYSMNKRSLMLLNHALYRTGRFTPSESLKLAWHLTKNPLVIKAAGVTFGNRQTALEHLMHYPRARIALTLVRESNPHDPNAVAVIAAVVGKGSAKLGYLPREWAALFAPLLDRGVAVPVCFETVTGGRTYGHYGLRMAVRIA